VKEWGGRELNKFPITECNFITLTERVDATADDLEVGITELQKSAQCKQLTSVAFVRVKTVKNNIYHQYQLNAHRDNICHHDFYNNRIWVKFGVSKIIILCQ
jgi:hypothetical protein